MDLVGFEMLISGLGNVVDEVVAVEMLDAVRLSARSHSKDDAVPCRPANAVGEQ